MLIWLKTKLVGFNKNTTAGWYDKTKTIFVWIIVLSIIIRWSHICSCESSYWRCASLLPKVMNDILTDCS